MSSFTPGPWFLKPSEVGKNLCIYSGDWSQRDRLYSVYGVGEVWNLNDKPENQANAALIAAAPDLYEALTALRLQALQSPDLLRTEWGQQALDKANAALRKAEAQS